MNCLTCGEKMNTVYRNSVATDEKICVNCDVNEGICPFCGHAIADPSTCEYCGTSWPAEELYF